MSERISLEDAKLSEIKADLLKINSAILDLLPLETRIAEITNYPDFHSYKSMERNLEKLENAWEANTGQSSAAPYYRAMLALLMRDSERRLKDANFPSDIIALFEKWFGRVIKDLNVQPDAYYCFKEDSFLKDLAVCSLRMIPVGGAWTVELGSASRRTLIANGLPSFVGNIIFYTTKQKGFKPYFIIHTFDRYSMRFTSEEMERAYLRVAEMLKRNPKIKGIYRSSWFLDPEIKRISPRLSYLRQIPEENGAHFFKTGTRELDIQRATCNSPERKKLYDEGNYKPTCWGYIWPRVNVIDWAERKLQSPKRKDL